jgi:hypothetical protein
MEKTRKVHKVQSQNLKGRDYLGEFGGHGMIILK